MATTMVRRHLPVPRPRWQAALGRALAEGGQVRQLADSGAWIAISGTHAGSAYGLAVTNAIAHGCDCPAGTNGDSV